jgi:hypothetical protein
VATSGGVLAIYASYPVVAAAAIKGVIAATTPRDAFEQAVGYPAHRTLTMPMVPLGLLGGHDHCAPVCGDLAICGKCGWPQRTLSRGMSGRDDESTRWRHGPARCVDAGAADARKS